jgi:hypothetical protein
VELVIVSVPMLKMPPPSPSELEVELSSLPASFPLSVEPMTVSAPALKIPPPWALAPGSVPAALLRSVQSARVRLPLLKIPPPSPWGLTPLAMVSPEMVTVIAGAMVNTWNI